MASITGWRQPDRPMRRLVDVERCSKPVHGRRRRRGAGPEVTQGPLGATGRPTSAFPAVPATREATLL
jgi:hypothetical protein